MGSIVKFVSGANTYTFPGYQDSYSDNFAQLVTKTKRLPGAHGGFDQLGNRRALSPIGSVRFGFTMKSSTREGMQALRDDVREMAEWGAGKLFFQQTDAAAGMRWCYARVDNITVSERRDQHTDLHQPVSCVFQVADPFWYAEGNAPVYGVSTYGSAVYGGSALQAISGVSNTLTYSNAGNAFTLPIIMLTCGAGETVTNPVIQRLVNGTPVDEVSWVGTLTAGDVLIINTLAKSVTLNGVGDYANFDMVNADWIRILPGDNTILVNFDDPGDSCDFSFAYYARYI